MGANPPDNIEAVVKRWVQDPSECMRRGCEALQYWKVRADQLAADEELLHRSLPAENRRTLEGKRLLLLEEMRQHINHADEHIVAELATGFTLAGTVGG